MELVLFCLGDCGGCLGGVMVLGMSFYVMMWVLVMGCVLYLGLSYSLFRWVFDAEWGSCRGGCLIDV